MATAHHRLIWRSDRQVYELNDQGSGPHLSLASDEERWLAWLETIAAFSFQGQQGQLTVRKEPGPEGVSTGMLIAALAPRWQRNTWVVLLTLP